MSKDTAPKSEPPTGVLSRYFQSTTSQMLAVLTATCVAAVGTIFSPLGDRLRDKLWPENIRIEQTVSTVEGKETPFKVALTDISSGAKISGGRIEISSADGAITIKGPTSFSFEPTDGSADIAPAEGISLTSRKPGESKLDVKVFTNKGKRFSGTIIVEAAAGEKAKASVGNISGDWRFILNKQEGELTLSEKDYRFIANGQFDNGPLLEGSGWRDGVVFHLKLKQRDGLAYAAEGIYCETGQKDNHFIVVNAKVVTKMNDNVIKNAMPLETIKQRCEGFSDLKKSEGDGAFFALVPLS